MLFTFLKKAVPFDVAGLHQHRIASRRRGFNPHSAHHLSHKKLWLGTPLGMSGKTDELTFGVARHNFNLTRLRVE
ncbi:MAG: hypothetical protein QNJ64_06415, partial [Crocosphaera sp.]|nr:hypothetical protein [Crocosphaera sp.]